jgi:hypothetical protein
LNFFPDVVFKFATILHVGVVTEVENFLYFCEVSGPLCKLHLLPQSVEQFSPHFGHLSSDGVHELREADEIGALFIENVEDMIDFGVSDVDSLIFDDLLELLVVEKGISVKVSIFHCFLEQQEAFGAFGRQALLYSQDDRFDIS